MSQKRSSRSVEIKARKKAFLKGQRAENVAKNPKYHVELNDHLNYREFKKDTADYVDQEGRLYSVATHVNIRTPNPTPISGNRVKLNVKLPPGVAWYPNNKIHIVLELNSTRPDKPSRTVTMRDRFMMMPSHRTGHVFIEKRDWDR